jgi:hypothetical protein
MPENWNGPKGSKNEEESTNLDGSMDDNPRIQMAEQHRLRLNDINKLFLFIEKNKTCISTIFFYHMHQLRFLNNKDSLWIEEDLFPSDICNVYFYWDCM